MGREIKFRGLRSDGKGWVYGDLLCNWTIPIILSDNDGNEYKVNTDSIGQFTGLKDRNGIEIYENDTVSIFGKTGIVFFNKETACFLLKTKTQTGYQLSSIRGSESIHEQIEVL